VARRWTTRSRDGEEREACQGDARLRRLQATELHHDQEQAERPRAHRDEEVLPFRAQAHHPQGNPLRHLVRPAGGSSSEPRDDEAGIDLLVKAARRGDSAAFARLVEATFADLYALAFRLVGNEHDAADAVQDAYLRIYRSIRRFRGDAAFLTWAYRITANCAATLVTRRARRSDVELDEGLAVADLRPDRDPETMAGAREDHEQIVAALAALPETLRLVVVLRDVYDLSHESIARELGISESAAKVRLHRARRRLRELLFPQAGAGERRGPGSDGAAGELVELRRGDDLPISQARERRRAV
jgi:RNA polymerase sigma-70 factor (ECF subfamily)